MLGSACTKAAAFQTFLETSDPVLLHVVRLTKAFAYLKLAPQLLRNTKDASALLKKYLVTGVLQYDVFR